MEGSGQDAGFGEHPVKSVPARSCKQQAPHSYTCSVEGVPTHRPVHAQTHACASTPASWVPSELRTSPFVFAQRPPKCHLLKAAVPKAGVGNRRRHSRAKHGQCRRDGWNSSG